MTPVTSVGELARSQLLLRALILVGPVVAVLASGPAGHWPPWWMVGIVAALAGTFAALPESPVGAATFLAVLAWWAAALEDGLHPAVLVAAAALLASHVAAVVVSYGPGEMPVDPALVRRWLGRGLLLLLTVPALWVVARQVRGDPDQPGVWLAGLAAGLVATILGAVLLTAGQASEETG